jgi:site-specific recombinase XerC
VVRRDDGEAGLAARTIARRLSSVRGLYAYLAARGDTGVVGNPVPVRLAARRLSGRRGKWWGAADPCRPARMTRW